MEKGNKQRNRKEVTGRRRGRGGAEERKRQAPMATLSQQRSQRVTVRRTDRTPPRVTNASTYQTHTGAHGGVRFVCLDRKHSVGRVTD